MWRFKICEYFLVVSFSTFITKMQNEHLNIMFDLNTVKHYIFAAS